MLSALGVGTPSWSAGWRSLQLCRAQLTQLYWEPQKQDSQGTCFTALALPEPPRSSPLDMEVGWVASLQTSAK